MEQAAAGACTSQETRMTQMHICISPNFPLTRCWCRWRCLRNAELRAVVRTHNVSEARVSEDAGCAPTAWSAWQNDRIDYLALSKNACCLAERGCLCLIWCAYVKKAVCPKLSCLYFGSILKCRALNRFQHLEPWASFSHFLSNFQSRPLEMAALKMHRKLEQCLLATVLSKRV